MLKITESVKTEIEVATGQTIPDPQSAGFEAFFEGLEREHPDLARKLEDALEVTEPFPEEEAQQNAKRRETIAQLIQRFFFKEIWGRDVLNRRALTFILFFLIFGTVATSWTVMLLRKPGQDVAAQTSVSAGPVQPIAEEPLSTPETTMVVPEPNEVNLLVVPEAEEPAQSKAPPPNLITPVPDAPKDIPVYTGEVPQESMNTPSPPNTENFGEPTAITLFEESPGGLESSPVFAFEKEIVAAPVLAFEIQPTSQEAVLDTRAEEQTEQTPVLADSFMTEENSETVSDVGEGVSSNSSVLTNSPVLAFEKPDAVVTNESPEEQSPLELPAPTNVDMPKAEATTTNNEPLLEANTLEPQTDAKNLLQMGELIPATLVKDIVLAEGETKQVIADSEANWCGESCPPLRWLGEATLSESGRLEVHFNQAVLDGDVVELNGVAYGNDNAQGLPAHIADATPTLLADLLRSSAGGVTDYVEAQTNQKRTTTNDDTTVIEESVPPLLDFILGRAASVVQIPEEDLGVIRLAAVEKGTRLEVLYLEP
jgi:hypothetical protein